MIESFHCFPIVHFILLQRIDLSTSSPSPRSLMLDTSAASEQCSPLELLAGSPTASTAGLLSSARVMPARTALPELSRALLYAADSLVYELALWPLGLPPHAADLTAGVIATGAPRPARGQEATSQAVACAAASLVASWDREHSLRRSCGRRVFCELVWLNAARLASNRLTRMPFFALSSGSFMCSFCWVSQIDIRNATHSRHICTTLFHQQMIVRTTGRRCVARVWPRWTLCVPRWLT